MEKITFSINSIASFLILIRYWRKYNIKMKNSVAAFFFFFFFFLPSIYAFLVKLIKKCSGYRDPKMSRFTEEIRVSYF